LLRKSIVGPPFQTHFIYPLLSNTLVPIFEQEVPSTGSCKFVVGRVVGTDLFKATPLFQTNFFPDLTHVKVFPEATDVIPIVLQPAPALTAAFAGIRGSDKVRESIERNEDMFLFIIGVLS
jgi:hypothetical protein